MRDTRVLSMALMVGVMGVGALATGCNQLPARSHDGDWVWPGNDNRLVGSQLSPIPDVPMPVGFEPVVSRCRSSVIGESRRIDHTYQGRSSLQAVANLYRRDLRLEDWELVEDSVTGDDLLLRYVKDHEQLNLTITRTGRLTSIQVRIRSTEGQHPDRSTPRQEESEASLAAGETG